MLSFNPVLLSYSENDLTEITLLSLKAFVNLIYRLYILWLSTNKSSLHENGDL